MSNFNSVLRELNKMRKMIQPPSEEILVMIFEQSNEYIELSWNEYHEAERSSWNGQPNELAQELERRYKDGDIDDGGLVCFFFGKDAFDWGEE